MMVENITTRRFKSTQQEMAGTLAPKAHATMVDRGSVLLIYLTREGGEVRYG